VAVTLTADTAYRVAWPASATVLIASDDLPPDLVVTAISAPGATAAGATISVSDTTTNQGTGAAAESITGFYLSIDTKFDTADVRLGTRNVPSLGPGAISTALTAVQIPASVATGTYYVIARADDGGVVPENLENNNVKASAAVQAGPDLVVSALSGPSSAAAGGAVALSVTTKNQGGAAAPSSSTALYLSSNVFLETSDPLLGSRTVPALGAGAGDAASVPVTIPASTVPGLYYIIAKADSNGMVAETQESNNQRLGPYMKIGPDLIVASVSVPATAGAGMALTVTDRTSNAGGATAPDSRTSFFLSTNLSLDGSDQLLGSRVVPSLGAGEASTASTPVQIPAATPTGTYYVFAKADSDNAVVESVETNNVSSPVSARIGPDLVIASISAPGTGGAAGTITITETTKNQGGATSPASTTMFYLSTNGSLDAADVLLGQRVVPELAGGTSSAATTSLPIPAGTVTGSYYLIAKADGLGVVVESNETNNLSYGVLVRVGPDLVVSSLVVPGSAAIGSPIAVTDTTTNQGNRPAPSSTTRFYLSANYSLDAADVLIGSRTVGALDAAGSNTAATTLAIPAGTAAGAYYVIAVADGESTVGEAVETNNTRAVYIRIS
jgi:subtilase family serine protease